MRCPAFCLHRGSACCLMLRLDHQSRKIADILGCMRSHAMSFLSALFGGRDAAKAEKPSEPVEYKGFIIRAAPFKSEGQYPDGGCDRARHWRCPPGAPFRPRRRVCLLRRCGDLHARQSAADDRFAGRTAVWAAAGLSRLVGIGRSIAGRRYPPQPPKFAGVRMAPALFSAVRAPIFRDSGSPTGVRWQSGPDADRIDLDQETAEPERYTQ